MKRVDVAFHAVEEKELHRHQVLEREDHELISESTLVYVDGEPKIAVINLGDEIEDMRTAIRRVKQWNLGRRGSGVPSESVTFGYKPRTPTRNHLDYCSKAPLHRVHPVEGNILLKHAATAEKYYKEIFPKTYESHGLMTKEKIRSEYHMSQESVYTSGILNRSSPLPYHLDRGNFDNVMSSMFVFKHQTQGGHLHLPELQIRLEIPDRCLVIFDGQSIWHGVTPIIKKSPQAYRYSVVYYSLKALWHCLAPDEELKYAQKTRTQREQKRAGLLT